MQDEVVRGAEEVVENSPAKWRRKRWRRRRWRRMRTHLPGGGGGVVAKQLVTGVMMDHLVLIGWERVSYRPHICHFSPQ